MLDLALTLAEAPQSPLDMENAIAATLAALARPAHVIH
jgi:hypothetical protein